MLGTVWAAAALQGVVMVVMIVVLLVVMVVVELFFVVCDSRLVTITAIIFVGHESERIRNVVQHVHHYHDGWI